MKGVHKEIFSSDSIKNFFGTTEIAIEISGRSLPPKNIKEHILLSLA